MIDPIDNHYRKDYRAKDLQKLEVAAEKMREAIMMMEGNIDVMKRLRSFYLQLLRTDGFLQGVKLQALPGSGSQVLEGHVAWIDNQINVVISDMSMIISRARLVVSIAAQRSGFVGRA